MLRYLARKLFYGCLVLLGVVFLIFFLFQGFGDPARLVIGQTGDSATLNNIRKELALDQPKSVQLLQYLNDVSPVAVHSKSEIAAKQLKGWFFGSGDKQLAILYPMCFWKHCRVHCYWLRPQCCLQPYWVSYLG